MIVLNILGYFGRNKQNSYAALTPHVTRKELLFFGLHGSITLTVSATWSREAYIYAIRNR